MSIIQLFFQKEDPKLTSQKNRITAKLEKDKSRYALVLNILLNADGTLREIPDETFLRVTNFLSENGNRIFPT